MMSPTAPVRYALYALALLTILSVTGCGKASEPTLFHPAVSGAGGSGENPEAAGSGAGDPGGAGQQSDLEVEQPVGTAGTPTAGTAGSPIAGSGEPPGDPAAGTGGMGVTSDPVIVAGNGGGRIFDAGSDPNRNQVTPGQVCERLSTIQCAGEAFCCADPGRDFATCKQVMFEGCTSELMLDAVTLDPAVGYDEAYAEQAFTEYERKTSECDTSIADWAVSRDGLRAVIKGTIESDQSCAPSALVPSDEENAAALASCKYPETHACLPTAAVIWRCSPLNDAGGRCMTDLNCKPGLYCDNPELKVTGSICKVRKGEGEECELPNECASLMCKRDTCVPADQQAVFCLEN